MFSYLIDKYKTMNKNPSTQSTIDQEDVDKNELLVFKQKVAKYCEIDNKIKQYEQVVKGQKKIKEELCAEILEFMEGYEISDLNTPFGKIQKVQSQTKEPLTKALIEKKVEGYFNKLGLKDSKDRTEALIKDLYENREKKQYVRLKRVTPRTKKEKDDESSKKINIPEGLKKI